MVASGIGGVFFGDVMNEEKYRKARLSKFGGYFICIKCNTTFYITRGNIIKRPICLCDNCYAPKRAGHTVDYLCYKKRKEILVTRGQKCEICGLEGYVEMHHKNRDRKNNSDENVILLCKRCHACQHLDGPFSLILA